MERSVNWLARPVLFGLMAIGLPAFGQPTDEHEADPENPPTAEEAEEAPAARAPKARGEDAFTRRYIAQLQKLRELMEERLDLGEDQELTIHKLFEQQIAEIRQGRAGGAASRSDKVRTEEIEELKQKLRQARQEGDEQAERQIRAQIRDLMRERRSGVVSVGARFIARVEEELDDEQREQFREIVRELGLDIDSESGSLTIQQLMRAVMAEEIGLSDEQRRSVLTKIREGFNSLSEDAQDAGDLDEIVAQLRADLRKELTTAQWAKVEKLLKENPEEGETVRRPRPGHVPEAPAEEPESDENPEEGDEDPERGQ